jgi:hypothetical protein
MSATFISLLLIEADLSRTEQSSPKLTCSGPGNRLKRFHAAEGAAMGGDPD